MPRRIGEARRHPEPLNFMPPVAVKRCAPAPIRSHCPYLHRKRQPSRRAERQNPHSGSTVALRGFVQDGFCNGCPLRDHAAIALAISHHRNLNIVRRYLGGSVEPYFGDDYFWCAPCSKRRRNISVIWRQVGLQNAGRNAGADDGKCFA